MNGGKNEKWPECYETSMDLYNHNMHIPKCCSSASYLRSEVREERYWHIPNFEMPWLPCLTQNVNTVRVIMKLATMAHGCSWDLGLGCSVRLDLSTMISLSRRSTSLSNLETTEVVAGVSTGTPTILWMSRNRLNNGWVMEIKWSTAGASENTTYSIAPQTGSRSQSLFGIYSINCL